VRELVVIEFVTLDGVMQGLGSPDEDREGGFEHGGWAAPFFDEVQGAAAVEGMKSTTAYLFGRRTYEKMIAFWPSQPDENPMAAHLNATPKYVATRTLSSLDWSNSQVLDGELASAVRVLKSQGAGNIAVLGSGALVQRAHRERPRRRIPLVPAPTPPRHRPAAVPGDGSAEAATARRLHTDHHRRAHARLRL